MSLARQRFHEDCEKGINAMINLEFGTMNAYEAMAAYFDRDDVALPGIASFFKGSAAEEKRHAEKFIEYQNKRGGRVVLGGDAAPEKQEFATALEAFETALGMEKKVNTSLLELHATADKHNDYQMSDFIEGEFLKDYVESNRKLAGHIAQLKLVGEGHGLYHFDKTF